MTDDRLTGLTAIVTGGARGIGLAAAAAMARAGANVVVADIDDDIAQKEAKSLTKNGLSVVSCCVDIASADSVQAMVSGCETKFGGIDILVNNAALGDEILFDDITEEHWRKIMSVNLDGAMRCTKAALPSLKKSPAASIINVASIQGIFGQANAMPYATAKGGIVNMTRCMAVEFGPVGIRANAIAPGFIDTRMALLPDGSGHEYETGWFQDVFVKHGRLPLGRPGTPQDIAGPVVFLASRDSAYITGQVIAVDGGVVCTY